MMRISPARIAAYEVLFRVEKDHAFSSVLLPHYEADLSEKDAALCHQLVLGVLRRKLFVDKRIRDHAGTKRLDTEVLTALRIGAYQILELDRIPVHSAVNESVALVQRARKTSAKGFVNAVLRRVAEARESTGAHEPEVELSHPEWLLARWTQQFGAGRAIAIARANNEPSRIAYRFTGRSLSQSVDATPSRLVEGAFTVPRITPQLRALAEAGEIYFQDEASQLIARSISIPPGGKFLDVCAAPGGKTALVAAQASSSIVAGDLYFPRVEFLRSNCLRQGVSNVRVVQYDAAAALPFADGTFDSILLDAPCSGTGTISSNPEIRYFLRPEDIRELSRKQLSILNNASKLLRSGGQLFYSTCSLEREENEGLIAEFLDGTSDFRTGPLWAVDRGLLTPDGFGRTFPDRDGTDGFFFATLVRS